MNDGGCQWWQQLGQQEAEMKELWFFYFEQALAEGCNNEDAAKMADVNSANHLADMADNYKDEQKEKLQ